MGKQRNHRLIKYLPLVFVATFLVVVAPMLLVVWLRLSGVVTSVWAGTVIGVAVSLLAAYAGGAFWKTRTDSQDILFSELMLWGWAKRWRSERQLAVASDLLGLTTGRPHAIPDGRLTNEQKADLLTTLTSGLEASDPYTHGHSRRVARHASNIAKRMGLPREEVAKVRAAAAMHDVGKVDTPIAVLHKEGKLTDEEFAIIKRHPADGAVMVSTLQDDELTAMVRHHHERLDGTGYPDRLAGEAIPVGARIIAVADTFDAITSTRPYRHAHSHKKALDILVAEAGTQLDPDAVRAFCSYYSGRRPLTYWTILAHGRPRLASMLGGGLGTANATAVAGVMATAATAAAVGGAALGPLVGAPKDSSQALANVTAPHAPSKAASHPQQSRRHELLAPQARRDRPSTARKHRSTPAPHDATVPAPVPAPVTTPEQDSGNSPAPSVSYIQYDSPDPSPISIPGNQPSEDEDPKKDGGETQDNGHKGKGKEKGKGQDKDKGPENGKDKAPENGKDKAPENGKDKGPENGKGKPQGDGNGQPPDKGGGLVVSPAPAPGSPPGQGIGVGLGEPPQQPGGQGNGNGNGNGNDNDND